MEWKSFAAVFVTVFVAELGDKTQLATMLFAADGNTSRWLVFAAASLALVLAAGLGVMVGGAISNYVSERSLKTVAGLGFILIGLWTLLR